MSLPELAITCMINNDKAHTLHFVRYFTSIAGCHLILFLDDPGHQAFFEQKPENLSLVPCTEQYWHDRLGRQPEDMPEKQHTNIEYGASLARELGCTWCMSVDSDELVLNLDELIPKLDTIGEGFDLLRLLPAELVHTEATAFSTQPFQGYLFKYLWSDKEINRRLIRFSPGLILRFILMRKYTRRLFFGHFNGKTIFRLSAPITRYKQHKQFSKERKLPLSVLPLRYLILHHDAMNYETWLFKWKRRISGSTRATAISDQRKLQTAKIASALRAKDPQATRKLFRKWLIFSDREIESLKKAHFVFDLNELTNSEKA